MTSLIIALAWKGTAAATANLWSLCCDEPSFRTLRRQMCKTRCNDGATGYVYINKLRKCTGMLLKLHAELSSYPTITGFITIFKSDWHHRVNMKRFVFSLKYTFFKEYYYVIFMWRPQTRSPFIHRPSLPTYYNSDVRELWKNYSCIVYILISSLAERFQDCGFI
jgi:hypothetical protein